jgi:hypothetical protein
MHCVIERAISSHICVDLLKRKKKKKDFKAGFFQRGTCVFSTGLP